MSEKYKPEITNDIELDDGTKIDISKGEIIGIQALERKYHMLATDDQREQFIVDLKSIAELEYRNIDVNVNDVKEFLEKHKRGDYEIQH